MYPWSVLGIERTADAAVIRRAYARKLKTTRPDDDPEGFQRLLRAREAALREVAEREARSQADRADAPADTEVEVLEAPQEPMAAVPIELAPEAIAAAGPIRRIVLTGADEIVREASDTAPRVVIADEPEDEPNAGAAVPRIVVMDWDDDEPGPRPRPHRIDFAIEASEQHWSDARRLAAEVETLLGDPDAPLELDAVSRIIEASAHLPRAPRQEVEAGFIETLGRSLRRPTGELRRRRVARARSVLRRAEPAYGWIADDRLVHAVLGERDAAVFCQIARETRRQAPRRPGEPAGRPIGLMGEGDARAFFAGMPRYLKAYQALRRDGRLPWRFDLFAFACPHVWAFRHHRTFVALLALGGLWAAASLAFSAGFDAWYAGAAAALYLALHLGFGLFADRIMLWAGEMAALEARWRLAYDLKPREALFTRLGSPRSGAFVWAIVLLGARVLLYPYLGWVSLAEWAASIMP